MRTLSLVSVIIPTFNRRALLMQALASVRAQEGVELEIVVVDDASSDDTVSAVRGLEDNRIVVLSQADRGGVSMARNRGIQASRGEWISLLDDDDLWSPMKLIRQLAGAAATQRRWACSGSVTIDHALVVIAGSPPSGAHEIVRTLPFRNSVPAGASSVLVHRGMLREAGEFDSQLRHMADWDLWIRLGALGLPAVVNEPDVAYRLHGSNASADAEVIQHEINLIERRHVSVRNGAPIDRAFVLRWVAWNLLLTGRRAAAAMTYGRAAIAGDPLSAARAVAALTDRDIVRRTLTRDLDTLWCAPAQQWLLAFR